MKVWYVTLALLAITACAPSKPTDVSQAQMNMNMVNRVRAEAQTACSGDDGLKAVEWPYDSSPTGHFPPFVLGRFEDQPPGTQRVSDRNAMDVTNAMQVLAEKAPHFFEIQQISESALAAPAVYYCSDGTMMHSKRFRFAP